MQGFYTILLLVASNIFMTCAWYGHLKMKQQFSWFEHLPLIGVVLLSWFLAFFEYCFQVIRMEPSDVGIPFEPGHLFASVNTRVAFYLFNGEI